jgi:hypothetical protein
VDREKDADTIKEVGDDFAVISYNYAYHDTTSLVVPLSRLVIYS